MVTVNNNPGIVSKNERIPELENIVKDYMSLIPEIPRFEKKIYRTKAPKGMDVADRLAWEREEIKKCKYGDGELSGKMYFYYNYGSIENIDRGKIKPDFRSADAFWYERVNSCHEEKGKGIICVKRRRAGFSWKEAADALHDASFYPNAKIGMNSKTERDSVELFKKVKFVYDNLPSFLRATTTAGSSRMEMDFAYFTRDSKGNKIRRGTQSNIFVVSPTPNAFEGRMLNKWVCDEAGKIDHLPQLWSYTEDCLMQETVRSGIPLLFGTAGEIGKEGIGLKRMWDNAHVYNLERIFFGGWMGLITDEFGNDMVEDAVRWIVYQRKKRENLSEKDQVDFKQRYPLTIEEAFMDSSNVGVGNRIKINQQISSLSANPPRRTTGYFRQDATGKVIFNPSADGKVVMYEPVKEIKNLYVIGVDPADHDDVGTEASDMSLHVIKKQEGAGSPYIVCEYVDRPKKAKEYYEQSMLIARYYNETSLLVERNRYRMISFMEEAGYKHLIKLSPQGVMRMVGGRSNTMGVHMNDSTKEYMITLIEEYIEDYCELIPSIKLLEQFLLFGVENTDLVMSFGIALMSLKDESVGTRPIGYKPIKPSFKYMNQGGRVVRVRQ